MEMHYRTRMTWAISLSMLLALLLSTSRGVQGAISARDQQALAKAELVYVATIRKNGMQSKAAPVWFTTGGDNNSILIQTRPTTWKAKRIKRGSHVVLLWVGKEDGPALIGQAEITSSPEVQNKILKDFRKKYWRNRVMGVGPSRAKFDSGEVLAIKITPVRDLPDGFNSQPGAAPPPLEPSGR